MANAVTYWRAMWFLLALATVAFVVGLAVFGSGFGTPLLWTAAFCLLGALLALRMWMWQKAYEGKSPN